MLGIKLDNTTYEKIRFKNYCQKEPSYSDLKNYKSTLYADKKAASIYFYNKDSPKDILFNLTVLDAKYDQKIESLKKYLFGEVNLIDLADLKTVFPGTSDARLKEVSAAINKYGNEFGINTPERIAAFLGQIGAETGGLNNLTESSNYTEQNIKDNFLKKKYCDLFEGYNLPDNSKCPLLDCNPSFPQDLDLKTLSIKSKYVKSSSLFDYVYGCRMGNGAPSTKDGSTYKGKGFIHLTGKEMYKQISDEWNKKYPNDKKQFDGKDINLLETNVETAMKASMIYWDIKKLNNKIGEELNDDIVDSIGRKVNGVTDNTQLPNGYEGRRNYTNKAYETIK
jgi:predicted chitinase